MWRWMFVVAGVGVCGLFAGCGVAGWMWGGASNVLYLISNRTGGDVTFDLEANGRVTESVSLAAEGTKMVIDDCLWVDDFRMRLVCPSEGQECNNLGIIIVPDEVYCGDVIDVYIDPAVDGQLQLSAYRRNSDGTSGETSGGSVDQTN